MNGKQSLIYVWMIAIVILLYQFSIANAEDKVFVKEYTYQASEQDSKITCRTNALTQVKRLLLEELGLYIESHTKVTNLQLTQDDIVSVSTGVVKTEIIDESWDGRQYWIKANLTADPDEVLQSVKESKKATTKEPKRLIKRNQKYRISFHAADIKPGAYGNDDSNPAPDAYVIVKDEKENTLFNSGDSYIKQNNLGALMGNRNNYTPNFRGVGFNHTFSNGCISVFLMDWDGCEGFMCQKSSEDDVIGSSYRICAGDKIGKRWVKADEWQMEIQIIQSE